MKGVITKKEKERIEELIKDERINRFLNKLDALSLKYKAAMMKTENMIKILNEDFQSKGNHNPIEYIETRLKTPQSLIKKMLRNNVSLDIDNIKDSIFDIAGVRIVCTFISDIYQLVNTIELNQEIEVLTKKDYIKNPKESGYRSYHMIIKIPIYLTTGKEDVVVEIQIRTIAMDFWASLEHKIKYKFDGIIPLEVKKELIECSNNIAYTDNQMMQLNEIVKKDNNLI